MAQHLKQIVMDNLESIGDKMKFKDQLLLDCLKYISNAGIDIKADDAADRFAEADRLILAIKKNLDIVDIYIDDLAANKSIEDLANDVKNILNGNIQPPQQEETEEGDIAHMSLGDLKSEAYERLYDLRYIYGSISEERHDELCIEIETCKRLKEVNKIRATIKTLECGAVNLLNMAIYAYRQEFINSHEKDAFVHKIANATGPDYQHIYNRLLKVLGKA